MPAISESYSVRRHVARVLLACQACSALHLKDGSGSPLHVENGFFEGDHSSHDHLLRLIQQPVVTSLCRKNELMPEDRHLKADDKNQSRGSAAWQALFQHWHGKRILLAGDSLMDQVFQVIQCAAELMGGETKLLNVAKFLWGDAPEAAAESGFRLASGTMAVNTSAKPFGFVKGDSNLNLATQGLVYRITIPAGVPIDGSTTVAAKTIDYYRYYSLSEACRTCGPGCGFCSSEQALVTRIDTLVLFAKRYDRILLNLGHDMGDRLRANEVRGKAEAVANLLVAEGAAERTTFVEHPAQHFPGSTHGDWMHSLEHKKCQCNNPDIDDQNMAVNNKILNEVAEKHGISVARMWSKFAKFGCAFHRPPDCTHYLVSPTVWSMAAMEMVRST